VSGKVSGMSAIQLPQWAARARNVFHASAALYVLMRCREVGGIYNPRHHLVVSVGDFDVRALRAWLEARVQEVEAGTWLEVGERLGRLGYWEFENYRG
jgi:hypothetical protein